MDSSQQLFEFVTGPMVTIQNRILRALSMLPVDAWSARRELVDILNDIHALQFNTARMTIGQAPIEAPDLDEKKYPVSWEEGEDNG